MAIGSTGATIPSLPPLLPLSSPCSGKLFLFFLDTGWARLCICGAMFGWLRYWIVGISSRLDRLASQKFFLAEGSLSLGHL